MMENRRRILLSAAGEIPPENLFSGGELITVSASSAVSGAVPKIPFSEISVIERAVYLFGFSPVGTKSAGNNYCVYKYRKGVLKKLVEQGCSMTVKAIENVNCFCFTNSSQGKLGLMAALCFSASEGAADRLLSKMRMKYYDFPRSWVINASPKVQVTQLRLESGKPLPGDVLLLASQWVNSTVPAAEASREYFGAYACGTAGEKIPLCGDNKLLIQSGTWGAVDCTDQEMTQYSDFSIYDTQNAYGRIYGLSFEGAAV